MSTPQLYVFALVLDGMEDLPRLLRAAFTHPWVESYQIGFGPPLVGSSERLVQRIKQCTSALEKLDAYLEHCIFDPVECKRLAELQRRILVRRFGPVEAESLTEASMQALDLRIRLQMPPNVSPQVHASMKSMNVDFKKLADAPRSSLAAQFVIRLNDPKNNRLLGIPELSLHKNVSNESALALELRTPVAQREYWRAFLKALSEIASFSVVDVGDPRAWAKVSRDGRKL